MINRFVAPILLAACVGSPALAQGSSPSRRPVVLIHGNYCGPGNNAPLAPIDALDAACARHDACTPDDELPSKACNARLQAEAERVASDPRQPEDLRMMAGLVATGAAMMPAEHTGTLAQVAAPATRAERHDTVRRSISTRFTAYGG